MGTYILQITFHCGPLRAASMYLINSSVLCLVFRFPLYNIRPISNMCQECKSKLLIQFMLTLYFRMSVTRDKVFRSNDLSLVAKRITGSWLSSVCIYLRKIGLIYVGADSITLRLIQLILYKLLYYSIYLSL